MPGGGQNQGETQIQALEQACSEELGTLVTVEKMIAAYEEILTGELNEEQEIYRHKVTHLYLSSLKEESFISNCESDLGFMEFAWSKIYTLPLLSLYPPQLVKNWYHILKMGNVLDLGSEAY